MLDIEKLIANVHEYVERAVAPLHDRIKELESRQPEKGEDGKDGKDAEPVLVADVVEELVKSDLLAPILDLYVEERVAKHFAENPVKHGREVRELFKSEGGNLIAVLSDGSTKDLGHYVGKDGEDGLGFEDATLELEDGAAVLKLSRGDVVKTLAIPLPTMKHVGFWQSGMAAKAGETTTHDGSLWLALRDTSDAPSYQSKDWQLAARKGTDGQPGKPGKDYRPPEPVKLGKPDA